MAKRKRHTSRPAVTEQTTPSIASLPSTHRWRAVDALALLAAVLCVVLGYLSRNDLSPDGVSYLDLATAIQRGDWSQYVQGYWSPLLPFVAGTIGKVLGLAGPKLIPLAHALNTIAALCALTLLWWWARRKESDGFGLAAIGTFLTCSYGLPRIESVTPDVLLLALVIWLSYEILVREDRRWLIVGVLLGLCFLAKTSSWPWLLLAVPLRFWAAQDVPARRAVLWSTALCAATMALWIVPMSLNAGKPTLGSSGRLNFSWYFLGSTSGLPDRDMGRNSAYQEISLGNGQRLTLATFDDASNWTYQPWGDPTAWDQKVVTNDARVPTLPLVLRFWGRAARIALGKWLLPLLAAVTIPVFLLQRRDGMWRALLHEQRGALVVLILGLAGVLQFIAVHSEPRLIAPGAAMFTLGIMHWSLAGEPRHGRTPWLRVSLSWIGVVVGIGLAVPRLVEATRASRETKANVERMRDFANRMAAAGQPNPRIAIVGSAAPLLGAAYTAGAHVSGQLLPRSLSSLSSVPRQQQAELVASLFRGKAVLLWAATPGGGVSMWAVPPEQAQRR